MGTVDEYIESFELVSAQVPRLMENQYLGYFLGRLRPDIRQGVRSFHPDTQWKAMQVARDMERKLEGTIISSDIAAYRARLGHATSG